VFTIPPAGIGDTPARISAFQPSTPNQAYAINNAGAVAGWTTNAANEKQAFVAKTVDGPVSQPSISVQDATGGLVLAHWSEARAINTAGDIAGCAAASVATAGDCSGAIVNSTSGIQAFMIHNGTPIALGVPSGFDESFALGISDHGLVVGTAHGSSGSSAFLWYFDDGQLKTADLSALLPNHDSFQSLTTATAITDAITGTTATSETLAVRIVGEGLTGDSVEHAFLLDLKLTVAVPEPQTWTLLFAGLALLGWVGRQGVRDLRPRS
jgi:uncharacterized membrane protein